MPAETPKEKFLRLCPGGFSDPLYLRYERDYKWAAHEAWHELLNEPEFDRLLTEEDYEEVCRRAVRIEGKTRFMLTRYEKAALHDGVRGEKPAKLFANGLYDLVYGDDDWSKSLVDPKFPDTEECPRLERIFLEPPKPPAALDNYMDAIDGDGSPWSYMCASLLARQLAEFGAMWHGCDWDTHSVLDENPCTAGEPPKEGDTVEGPMTPANEWKWSEPAPEERAPHVSQEVKAVTATFFTYSGLGEEAIYRHIDTYKPGEYKFKSDRRQIATGRGGFVF